MPGDNSQDVVQILAELVEIESVNPYFPGGARGEAGMAAYVANYCKALDLAVSEQAVLPGRANVIAELKVPGAERTLLFDVHLDTVSLDAMGPEGLRPRVESGRVTGRGSCDDKASLAAMLVALRALARSPSGLRANVTLLASADEEYLMRGAETFARSGVSVDGAIVGEPTLLRVVTAHKGFVRWTLSTHGVACHSSNPHLGDNAIYQMAELLTVLRPRLDELVARRPHHPLVGGATWSVGKISGGASVNIVPEACSVEIDRRLLPGENSAEVLAELDALLGEITRERPHLKVSRAEPFGDVAAIDTPVDNAIVRAAQKGCVEVLGEARPVGVAYGTNASKFAEVGIPCVVLGPGDIAQAHTAGEWVAIEQLTKAARIYEAIARAF
ncbi:MAG TPA: M20 family metallopeptidase [Chloroflexota bacterium]|nr:M20 family metallopeptidase [Chloroflexota bacterium]